VPANVEVVMFAPATATDLKPGAKVLVAAAKKMPESTAVAGFVVVGHNGVNPPM
jgi:hypothetical protein